MWPPISYRDNSITWELVGNANLLYPPWTYLIRNPSKLGFPDGSSGRQSTCNAGDAGSIPELERSPGEGNGNLPQYSCLENSMDRGAWRATVHSPWSCKVNTTERLRSTKVKPRKLCCFLATPCGMWDLSSQQWKHSLNHWTTREVPAS